MSKKVNELQNRCFQATQRVAAERSDYRGAYARYIGELEGILTTLAIRDRAAEGDIEHLLRQVLQRFERDLASSHKEMAG